MKKIVPVILCGGSGTRLWPLSRQKMPKQFLKLLDEQTLLQKTATRTMDILGERAEELVVVTLEDMAAETRRELHALSPALAKHVLTEPEARNTAAAVAFAIQYVQETFGKDSYAWVLPADHYIGAPESLVEAVEKACKAADEGFLVTFGIQPTRAETGYGYIQKAANLNGSGAFFVEEFHEKPEQDVADQFFESGQYLWSSGMHLFRTDVARMDFEAHSPEVWNCVKKARMESTSKTAPVSEIYAAANKEPFETAVMESSSKVAVIPCDPKWSDIGSWESLWEVKSDKDANGNSTKGHVYCEDTRNSMILAQDKLVTCVGLDDVIVIETGDSVLVANKSCGSSLKNVVNLLREKKRRETVSHASSEESWGMCRNIFNSDQALIRECKIQKGQAYTHKKTQGLSQWVVAEGECAFVNGENVRRAGSDDLIVMQPESEYEIVNTGDGELKVYEVRMDMPFAGDARGARKTGMSMMKQKLGRLPGVKPMGEGVAA